MKKIRMLLITLALLLLSTQAAFADVAFGPVILFMWFIRYGYIAVIVVVGILLYRYIRKNRNAFVKSEKDAEKDQ